MPQSRARQAKVAPPISPSSASVAVSVLATPDPLFVVGIGASAGGLEACKKFVDALPVATGMAFILVQHLDPTRESMMVELLASHTSMKVLQAADGMPIERDHFYVIAPGTYLSVKAGALQVSQPEAPGGARLPVDFLLRSLSNAYGPRAVGVILSGTGADGSIGLKALKKGGGFLIVQDPAEAGYDGMPRSAIATGLVDVVGSVERLGEALAAHAAQAAPEGAPSEPDPREPAADQLPAIIELLRTKTVHDFTQYKTGTLQRRVVRRMGLMGLGIDEMQQYLDVLSTNPEELDLLAKDLLMNVTSFFRDPTVFDLLAKTVIPDMVSSHPADRALRVWIAGCSTGEETYSLAMLFREEIVATKRNIKLQVFASDIDADAVASAREGVYPESIAEVVSSARLARFFVKENHSYRVSVNLRASVVFTVQDVLADPPFARLDLISCRNLLIYLRPEAQARLIALFHYALREGAVLVLGSSETPGAVEGRFETIAKSERIYRHIGRGRPEDINFLTAAMTGSQAARRRGPVAPPRPASFAELCRRMVIESFAPAAALINRNGECLYFLGPIDSYLKVASGHPVHDLVSMARDDVRNKLRSTIHRASQENARIVATDCRIDRDGVGYLFSIAVQPVPGESDELLLVCFFDEHKQERAQSRPTPEGGGVRIDELEHELQATRAELQTAVRSLEISSEEQRAIDEEASSAKEEYQATNEELLTSKEELQSLNEELIALNGQLQETLERQRTTSNDMQNIIYSTDVATIFLDTRLNIRFFTPATRMLFSVIPGDVGRPIGDLSSLAADGELIDGARKVLHSLEPIEREIEARTGAWYLRRISPYRTHDDGVEGVVITFTDMTDRRRAADALEAAKRLAQLASVAKSRFLAAASHDLRQPLQTLSLLHGLLAKTVEGEKAQKLVGRLEETLGAMTGMLNTLLDINEIEAGTVHDEKVTFAIDDLLEKLYAEFAYHARAKNLSLRKVACSALIESDPGLLEQMLRNLLSNALKYTSRGKVLLGCRRRGGVLNIEIWDTGLGIPAGELKSIFEEYHQVDNAARERGSGLGLGLSIVQRLGALMGHRIALRSTQGAGSVFSIEVPIVQVGDSTGIHRESQLLHDRVSDGVRRAGVILVIEDDSEMRALLEVLLNDEGHHAVVAVDGPAALELAAHGVVRPDLILTDFNLPNGMDGIEVATKLQAMIHRDVPVIVLTGDISTSALRNIAEHKYVQLNKPVSMKALSQVIQTLLPTPLAGWTLGTTQSELETDLGPHVVYIVDDDGNVRDALRSVFEDDGQAVEDFASCEEFLKAYRPGRKGCLLVDAYLPGMSGLELLKKLGESGYYLPAIMVTGNSDVKIAVEAMKAGASDFIEKPVGRDELLASVARALEQARDSSKLTVWRQEAASQIADLTARQREIMDLVLAGHPSKNIAADLGISQRTVENHRAEIMKRTGSKSVPALVRLALVAAGNSGGA